MPRKAAAPSPAPSTPVEDPLADLREDSERYADQQTPQEGPQGAQETPGGEDPLSTLVGEACGAVSMCWDPTPEGEFQGEAASAIVDDLLDAIRPMLEVQALTADEAVERWHRDTVAVGFLHKGGRCGCAYVARVILGA